MADGREDDEELDQLLDSALDDFDKVQLPVNQQALPTNNDKRTGIEVNCNVKAPGPHPDTVTESDDKPPPPLAPDPHMEQIFSESFAEAAGDLEKAMKAMLGEGNQDFTRQLQNQFSTGTTQGGDQGNQVSPGDMEANLARTMSDLAQNAKDMENCNLDSMNEDFIKAMSGMNLEGAEGELNFMPLMQGMMKNLLAKEVLYPNLKELHEKYPNWLEENKSELSAEEYTRYSNQYKLVTEICAEYELDKPEDSEEVQKKRFEKLMVLMQRMQELGQPPTELVGEMPPAMNFGQEMPPMPEIPAELQNECKVS